MVISMWLSLGDAPWSGEIIATPATMKPNETLEIVPE